MKDNFWIYVIVVILILLGAGVIFGPKMTEGQGSETSEVALRMPTAVRAFFADKEYNAVELNPLDVTQSIVTLPGSGPTGGIFFMRFDVSATNGGTITKTVQVLDAKIKDANGQVVEENMVSSAFRCILNKPRVLTSGQNYVWSTDSTNPATGCSSLVWIPTISFENTPQPLSIVFSVKSEFTMFGITRAVTQDVTEAVAIEPDTGGFGSVTVNIVGGSEEFIQECKIPPEVPSPEVQLCPGGDIAGSVCAGKTQTCTDGLWPGCPDSVYGPSYTPGKESNGNLASDFKVTCKDGLDNDCDGVKDKPNADGSCPSGICDFDCPKCLVAFRTNANVLGTDDITAYEQEGIWISVETGTSFLTSYGHTQTQTVPAGSECNRVNTWQGGTASGITIFTPSPTTKKYSVYVSGTNAYIYYDSDSNPTTDCKKVVFNNGDTDRCKVGDTYYPLCISRFPVTTPFELNKQETCNNY